MITIPDNIDSKYRFVILSALRARQIQGGSSPMLKQEARNKATQLALTLQEAESGSMALRLNRASEQAGIYEAALFSASGAAAVGIVS